MRVGVVKEMAGEGYEQAVDEAATAMVEKLPGPAPRSSRSRCRASKFALSAYYLMAPAEASANLARFDGVRYGQRVAGDTAEDMMARTRAEGFGPEVTRRILLGTYALSAGYYDAFYGQAQKVRSRSSVRLRPRPMNRWMSLVSPTSPTAAFEAGDRDSRSAGDVSVRRMHHPVEPLRSPGDFGADRAR